MPRILIVDDEPAMLMVLADTSIWIDHFRRSDVRLASLLELGDVGALLFGLTISSVIQNGGFTKKGQGILNLTGANTYGGDTVVEAGVLRMTSAYLADGADVFLTTGGQLALAYGGAADDVRSLYFDGVPQVTGTWGATGSGAAHINDTFFRGPGKLNVLVLASPVPPVTNSHVVT